MEDCGPIKPGVRIKDLGVHVMRMIQLWKRRGMDVGECCGKLGEPFPLSKSTVLMRLNCPPTFDSLFVVKIHGKGRGRGARTETEGIAMHRTEAEGAAMHHARRRFSEAAPGRKLVPEVYRTDAMAHIIVMEYVHGRRYNPARARRWSRAQRRRFVRQMAVIRLMLMGKTASFIGTPALSPDGKLEIKEMVGDIYDSGGRGKYYEEKRFPLGPYKTVKEYALSALAKEIIFYNAQLDEEMLEGSPPGDQFTSWEDWIKYLTELREYSEVHKFRTKEPFVFSHLQPASGEHLVMRGSKIAALLDWQKSWYMPYSEAVAGVLDFPTSDREFPEQLQRYKDAGAESEMRPNWEVIDEYGGPLCEDDFAADFPSDDEGEDVHVGYEDGVSKYAESDDELEGSGSSSMDDGDDDKAEGTGKTWYLLPVWKLMHEYIMRGGEGGLKFEEAFRSPLAHWADQLVTALTSDVMAPDMESTYDLPDYPM